MLLLLFSYLVMSDSFSTLWTVAHQAPLSMRISRQEYWSGFLFASPGNLPDPGIEPRSSALQVDSLSSELPGKLNINNTVMKIKQASMCKIP